GQRARHEGGARVQRIQLVGDVDAGQRGKGEVLDLQRVAQAVAGERGRRRGRLRGQVGDGLEEEVALRGGRERDGVLEVEHARRAVGQRAVVLAAAGGAGGRGVPLGWRPGRGGGTGPGR